MYRLVVIDDEYIVVQGIKALISRLKLDYEVVGAGWSVCDRGGEGRMSGYIFYCDQWLF